MTLDARCDLEVCLAKMAVFAILSKMSRVVSNSDGHMTPGRKEALSAMFYVVPGDGVV